MQRVPREERPMSEMDTHDEVEVTLDDAIEVELEDPEVPAADAVEQAASVTESEPDHETLPLDEDEYR
jgi:hypothetical protein